MAASVLVVALVGVSVWVWRTTKKPVTTNTSNTVVNDRTTQPALAATVDFSTTDLPDRDPGFSFDMKIPAGWRVEYLAAVKAINLYVEKGSGTTLERSQMVIQLPISLSQYRIASTEKKTYNTITADQQRLIPKTGFQRQAGLPGFMVLTHDQYVVHASATSDATKYLISRNPQVISETVENILRTMTLQP